MRAPLPRRARAASFLVLLLGLMAWAGSASAQQPARPSARTPARRDTTVADTTRRAPVRAPDPLADSIRAALGKLDGYIITEYSADSVDYRSDEGTLRLRGNSQVTREGDQLKADSILYHRGSGSVEARGNPRVSGQAQELTGDVLFYDLASRRASAVGARTTISQAATWFVTGQVVSAVGTERVYAKHADFTTCDLQIPHYHFESDRIKVVKNNLLVAVPARLYFGKVPVLVLPFVVQNLQKGRRSGLLVPRLTFTDIVPNSPGYNRQISDLGWYWAISDYLGGQVAGTWRSGAYVSMVGDLAFSWRRQFLDGHLGFSRWWRSSGGREFGVNSAASWQPDERTNLGLSANYMSSAQFIRRTTIDPAEATQNMNSTFNLGRRFDWGMVQLGSELNKSIANGGITATLPSFSISPNPITLFRDPNTETAKWYNNATVAWGLSGSHHLTHNDAVIALQRRTRNETQTQLQGGLTQFSVGNLNFSATGSLNQRLLDQLVGRDPTSLTEINLPGGHVDQADWNANLGYRIRLIGQTSITPGLSLSQQIQRDSLTGGRYLAGPRRMSVGAGTSAALFGFYPGFGPYTALRHRITPTISYNYAPEVRLNAEQTKVFGASGGYAQNRVSLGLNQSWEGKLRDPKPQPDQPRDTTGLPADSVVAANLPAGTPTEPSKVTLLSISTSPIEYDFVRAAREGTGFVTTRISNSITSDFLRGLSIQMDHELFDQSRIDPNDPAQRGKLGSFKPRLSSISTGFDLGPSSAIFRWLGLGGGDDARNPVTQGTIPGAAPSDAPTPPGSQTLTNNPRSTGGGPWRMSIAYAFSRPPRVFAPQGSQTDIRTVQTVNASLSFPATKGWGVDWNTSYSITDGQFGSHRLLFRRDLHRWQANFSFFQTPTGNTAFEFFVDLIDNPDIKFDHRESNLGIDR